MFGVFALILALGAVAFTHAEKSPKTNYYWFLYDASGNQIHPTSPPAATSTAPAECDGTNVLCSRGFTGYTPIAGSPVRYQGSGDSPVMAKKK